MEGYLTDPQDYSQLVLRFKSRKFGSTKVRQLVEVKIDDFKKHKVKNNQSANIIINKGQTYQIKNLTEQLSAQFTITLLKTTEKKS